MTKKEEYLIKRTINEINEILNLEAKGWMSPKGMRAEATIIQDKLQDLICMLEE